MIFFLAYLAVFLPAVYTTRRLRALRKAPAGYARFMLALFCALLALGFLIAPIAMLGMLGLAGVAAKHTAQELAYRHREVQYRRGNRQVRPVPPGARRAQ